jgi:hypothetical protein
LCRHKCICCGTSSFLCRNTNHRRALHTLGWPPCERERPPCGLRPPTYMWYAERWDKRTRLWLRLNDWTDVPALQPPCHHLKCAVPQHVPPYWHSNHRNLEMWRKLVLQRAGTDTALLRHKALLVPPPGTQCWHKALLVPAQMYLLRHEQFSLPQHKPPCRAAWTAVPAL